MGSKIKPISYSWDGCLLSENGITNEQIQELYPRLQEIRKEIFESELPLFHQGGEIPTAMNPLDAGFIDLPERLLEEYDTNRDSSQLNRILDVAKRLRDSVDRVVVLGIGGSYMGARAIMECCCHPYHNLLTRAQRGGRPKIFFEGNNVDNDHSQALIDLLRSSSSGQNSSDQALCDSPDGRWGLVVISKSGGTMETAVAFRQFLRELESSLGEEKSLLKQLVVPITGKSGKLASLADAIGCNDRFPVPDGVGGRFSVFSAVGLLPAALMGVDIIALLHGAVAMNRRFKSGEMGDNPVLDYTAVCHLMEQNHNLQTRLLSVWTKSLESAGLWYDQLLAESLGKEEKGALPLTIVNTRDLHSRAQQHQEGRRDKIVKTICPDSWRSDPLPVGQSENNQDERNQWADKTLPDLMTAAISGTNQAYQEVNRPTADIRFPAADEACLGQWMQMMMLSTVVEGRLMGINPYGQPGVEAYKVNMKKALG